MPRYTWRSIVWAVAAVMLMTAARVGLAVVDEARLAVLRSMVEKGDRDLEGELALTPTTAVTRGLTHYARNLLVMNGDVATVEAMSLRAFDQQDMDPQSKTYGEVPWALAHRAEKEDKNAIEFTCLPLGAMLTRYADRLSPAFHQQIKPHVVAALAAINRHRIGVDYTNIYLMKISNLLLLGEAMHDTAAVEQALANLHSWLDYTRQNGIGEYNSTGYCQVQINSASTAYNNTANPQAKAMLKAVLDYLWADACASYYPSHQQLVGANSRDYDFVSGNGAMDGDFFAVGLREDRPIPTLMNDASGPFTDAAEAGYRPSAEILALATEPVKQYASGFGPKADMDRALYVTPEFAIGSAGRCDGPQGRGVGACLAGHGLPLISFFIDPFDAPDGTVRLKDKGGHLKPVHLRPLQAVVQRRETVLAVYDITAELNKIPASSIGLNVLLPAAADEIWLDGTRVDFTATKEFACHDGSVVIARSGSGAIAARLFSVEGLDGYTPRFALKNDCGNGKVARLVAYTYQGQAKTLTDKSVHAGLLLTAAKVETDAAMRQFVQRMAAVDLRIVAENNIFRARYDGLEAAMDRDGRAVARLVDGVDAHTAGPGQLNGHSLAGYLDVKP